MNQVYIGKILQIEPIPDAEKIELATVVCGKGGKWRGIVQKGQFQAGDQARVFLPDSLLPQTEEFAFMEKYKWRVRQVRFKGVPSECLIQPYAIKFQSGYFRGEVGDDITALSGVTKYIKPAPASFAGVVRGNFPPFIPRTDEPNYQTVPHLVEALIGQRFYSTEKVDGASATVYRHDGHFGVCSRNLEFEEPREEDGRRPVNNAIWDIARRYQLEEKTKEYDSIALQFEVIGPGIQKNPSGLTQIEPRLFNVYDVNMGYWDGWRVRQLADLWRFPMVKILDWDQVFTQEYADLFPLPAEGCYESGKQREGIVIRPMREQWVERERLSFKVANLLYGN